MYVDPDGTKAKWWNPTTWNWKKIKKTLRVVGSVLAGTGLVVAVIGATLTIMGIPVGPQIAAIGMATYFIGMQALVLTGDVNPNEEDFPEWGKKRLVKL